MTHWPRGARHGPSVSSRRARGTACPGIAWRPRVQSKSAPPGNASSLRRDLAGPPEAGGSRPPPGRLPRGNPTITPPQCYRAPARAVSALLSPSRPFCWCQIDRSKQGAGDGAAAAVYWHEHAARPATRPPPPPGCPQGSVVGARLFLGLTFSCVRRDRSVYRPPIV